MRNHSIGRCDMLDVLEEAAIFRKRVQIDLHERSGFTALVRDVYTENGEDFVIFEDHDRMSVSDISGCRSADERP